MAPPPDFTNAYNQGVSSSPTSAAPAERVVHHGQRQHDAAIQEQSVETGAYMSQDSDYEGQKRKRAYSMGGGYEGHHP